MARIRTIKPDFFTDEKLWECSIPARLYFIGLWCYADDEGRLYYSPWRLKMQLFPGDNTDIEQLTQELERFGLVERYTVTKPETETEAESTADYLWVKNFKRHQRVNHPTPSYLPAPPKQPNAFRTEHPGNKAVAMEVKRVLEKFRKTAIPTAIKLELAERRYQLFEDGEVSVRCHYCMNTGQVVRRGKNIALLGLEFDHIVPLSKGGEHHTGNITIACRSCNRSKGDKDLLDWIEVSLESPSGYKKKGLGKEGNGKEGNGIDEDLQQLPVENVENSNGDHTPEDPKPPLSVVPPYTENQNLNTSPKGNDNELSELTAKILSLLGIQDNKLVYAAVRASIQLKASNGRMTQLAAAQYIAGVALEANDTARPANWLYWFRDARYDDVPKARGIGDAWMVGKKPG